MKINGKYKYRVNEKLEVEVWNADADETQQPPWLRQPGVPGEANFSSTGEAESWADTYLARYQILQAEAELENLRKIAEAAEKDSLIENPVQ